MFIDFANSQNRRARFDKTAKNISKIKQANVIRLTEELTALMLKGGNGGGLSDLCEI